MATYKTSAIILRTYDFKDYDKIVVLYSKEHGIIRAIAKGVKRPKSPLGTRIEPLLAADLLVYKGRNLDTINQCDTIESFKNLRTCLKKISFGLHYLELTLAFGMEDDPNSETFYQFLFDSLKNLENANETDILELLLIEFQYKIITFAGYAPMLNCCNNCREDVSANDKIYFNTKTGTVVCHKCAERISSLSYLDTDIYKYFLGLSNGSANLSINNLPMALKAHAIMSEYITKKTNYKLKTLKLMETLHS